jgi:hypothetical protein
MTGALSLFPSHVVVILVVGGSSCSNRVQIMASAVKIKLLIPEAGSQYYRLDCCKLSCT